mmetsp:Transcript_10467/g.24822  ORF Transcript_10467/g.24822 Transcript_10467/m.24822 type:complete len:88 (-) Transcript_10467:684-947(-)|eukprot:3667278-Rhodomonas_salina.2
MFASDGAQGGSERGGSRQVRDPLSGLEESNKYNRATITTVTDQPRGQLANQARDSSRLASGSSRCPEPICVRLSLLRRRTEQQQPEA